MKKALLYTTIILITLAGIAYTVFWLYMAREISRQVAYLQGNAAAYNVRIDGTLSPVSGFPLPPRLHFKGNIIWQDLVVSLPDATIQGFPLPTQKIHVALPQGAYLTGMDIDPDLAAISYLDVTWIVPMPLPRSTDAQDLQVWKDAGGVLEMTDFTIHKDTLVVTGKGLLQLDDALQPAGSLEATIKGHNEFLTFLQNKNLVDAKEALIAGLILNSLTKQDADTGERYMQAVLTLQKRKLRIGPLDVLTLPPLAWK